MEKESRVFIPDRAVRLITSLLTVPAFRSLGKKILNKKISEKIEQLELLGIPTRMVEDQAKMFQNLIGVMDRWLLENRISRHRAKKFFTAFGSIMNERNRRPVEEFEKCFGYPPPKLITLSPTKKCNLACKGCYAASAANTDISLPWDIADRILTEQKSLWGAHFTTISGGEPLLYESQGRSLLDLCEKHNDMFFLMYTNGTQITKETAKRMADLANITPSISIEGYEAETDDRRGKGVYSRILKAIENLREAGVLFGISITVTKNNVDTVFRDEFRETYFNKIGAYYGWIFQYMPIGRSFSLDLVIPPAKRLEMFRKTRKWIHEEGLVLPDFWNSAVISNGCISAAKDGGYIYIDWNGNVTPCVFNPYTVSNIKDVYSRGGSLNDVIDTPFFRKIRQWQDNYFEHGFQTDAHTAGGIGTKGNQLTPCPVRDHYAVMRSIIDETGAQPLDDNADAALEDRDYYRGMTAYGEEIGRVTRETWEKEYLGLKS